MVVCGPRPPLDLGTVHRRDGELRLGVGAHFDEPEPLGPARVPVYHIGHNRPVGGQRSGISSSHAGPRHVE